MCVQGCRTHQVPPSFLIYRFLLHGHVQDIDWQRGCSTPVPLRKDKMQVTNVGSISLTLASSLLFFHCGSVDRIKPRYFSDTLHQAPGHTTPNHVRWGSTKTGFLTGHCDLCNLLTLIFAAQCIH